MAKDYPCPCCGHLVFEQPPGNYEICPVCFWEDDIVQLAYPLMGGGANKLSLFDAQREFARSGVSDPRCIVHVRPPQDDEPLEAGWRPFDPATDPHLQTDSQRDNAIWKSAALDSVLYYWRSEYWLLNPRMISAADEDS
jgi:hypothetical protein